MFLSNIRMVSKMKDLFVKSETDLGQTDNVMIELNHVFIRSRSYIVPLTKQKVTDKAVDRMVNAKVIESSQESSY